MKTGSDVYDLDRDECDAHGRLKESAGVLYSSSNQNHEKVLKELYDEFVKSHDPPADQSLKTKAWGALGFQGENPRTDFRGGGAESLVHLLRFCRESGTKLEAAKRENERGMFLLACTSIGCTYWLKNFFHLNEVADFRKDYPLASRRGLKNFCKLLVREPDALGRLHFAMLTGLFDLWVSACEKNQELTLIDIGSAEKLVREGIVQVFQNLSLNSITDAENAIVQQRIDPLKVTKFKM